MPISATLRRPSQTFPISHCLPPSPQHPQRMTPTQTPANTNKAQRCGGNFETGWGCWAGACANLSWDFAEATNTLAAMHRAMGVRQEYGGAHAQFIRLKCIRKCLLFNIQSTSLSLSLLLAMHACLCASHHCQRR